MRAYQGSVILRNLMLIQFLALLHPENESSYMEDDK